MGPDKVERFIFSLRDTHPNFQMLYLYGHCYSLFIILRTIWPDAEAWYSNTEGHVYTKIGKYWYDITGKHLVLDNCEKLDHKSTNPHRWPSRSYWNISGWDVSGHD